MKKIVYRNDNGGVSIVTPVEHPDLTVEQIAERSVPTGRPFKIVDVDDIPADRQWRNEWTVDEAGLTDGVGA